MLIGSTALNRPGTIFSALRAAFLACAALALVPLGADANPRVFLCLPDGGSCNCVPDQPADYYVVHGLPDGLNSLDVCLRTDETPSSPVVTNCLAGGTGYEGDELCAWQIKMEGAAALAIQSFTPAVSPIGIAGSVTPGPEPANFMIVNWVDTTNNTGTGGGAGAKIFVGEISVDVDSTESGDLSISAESEAVDADFDVVAIDSGTAAMPVPEPGAVWMLFFGVLALVWFGRACRSPGAALALAILFAPPVDADLVERSSLLGLSDLGISGDEAADRSLASIGDINGDGVEDLAVGLPTAYRGKGALLIAMMRRDGSILRLRRIAEGAGIDQTMGDNAGFGAAVTNLGDLDGGSGPARTVLAVAAPGEGRVWILFLRPAPEGQGVDFISYTHLNLGYPVRALAPLGDLYATGSFVLAVGVPDSNNGCPNNNAGTCGEVGLLSLLADGSSNESAFITPGDANLPSFAENARFGAALAGVGDVDGDGVPDLVVGTPGYSSSGGVLLLNLSRNASVATATRFSEHSLALPQFLGAGADMGAAISPIPASDGSGVVGIAVGAPHALGPTSDNAGAVIVLVGEGPTGRSSLSHLSSIDAFLGEMTGVFGSGTEVGRALALIDLDGDGLAEGFVDSNQDVNGDAGGIYVMQLADADDDGIPDPADNCFQLANPNQEDGDQDGVGDLCDNCSEVPNLSQDDSDANGVGDKCEGVKVYLTAAGTGSAPGWRVEVNCGAYDVASLDLALVPHRLASTSGWLRSLSFGGGCGAPPSPGGGGGLGCPTALPNFDLGDTVDADNSGAFVTDSNGAQAGHVSLRRDTLYVRLKGEVGVNGPELCTHQDVGRVFLGKVESGPASQGEFISLSLSMDRAFGASPVFGLSPLSPSIAADVSAFEATTLRPFGANRSVVGGGSDPAGAGNPGGGK